MAVDSSMGTGSNSLLSKNYILQRESVCSSSRPPARPSKSPPLTDQVCQHNAVSMASCMKVYRMENRARDQQEFLGCTSKEWRDLEASSSRFTACGRAKFERVTDVAGLAEVVPKVKIPEGKKQEPSSDSEKVQCETSR